MRARIVAICAVVGVALNLAGCGTVDNICLPNPETGRVPLHVYGGVEADLDYLNEDNPKAAAVKAVFAPLTFIDIPLSIVGDTITLPVTIGATMWTARRHD